MTPNMKTEFIQLRYTHLDFGLRPSPAFLGAVIAYHVHKYHGKEPELCRCIEQSVYVDDLITGANSIDDTSKLYKMAKTLMSDGGFNLHKWKSNSPSLLAMII